MFNHAQMQSETGPAPTAGRTGDGARRARIDWRVVASLIAQGHTVDEVAARLGCPAAAIRRNLVRSYRFRQWIAIEQAGMAELARRRLARLLLKLPDAIETAVEKGNTSILTWLANNLVKGELGLDTPYWSRRVPAAADVEGESDDDDDYDDEDDDGEPAADEPVIRGVDEDDMVNEGVEDVFDIWHDLPPQEEQTLYLALMPAADLGPPAAEPDAGPSREDAAALPGTGRNRSETGAAPAETGRNRPELARIGRVEAAADQGISLLDQPLNTDDHGDAATGAGETPLDPAEPPEDPA